MKIMHCNKPAANQTSLVRDDRTNWLVSEPWCNAVVGDGSPNWFDLASEPRAELVKKGKGRQVWRVVVGIDTIYAKIFFTQNLADRIAGLIGRNKATREWRTLTQASSRYVSVPEPIALGVDQSNKHTNVLLTKALNNAVPLSQAWKNVHRDNTNTKHRTYRHAMIHATAALFADAHHKGFIHRDAHPGNILVYAKASDSVQAWFVDVLGSKMQTGKLTMTQVAQSLAQLDQYFHRTASRTDRLRFLIHYLKDRGTQSDVLVGSLRDYVRTVLSARKTHALRLAKQWDRRLRRDGKYFGVIRCAGGWQGCVVKQLSRRHVYPERGIPDRSSQEWQEIFSKATKHIDVAKFTNTSPVLNSQIDGLIFEWHQPAGFIERWRWTLFGSPCRDAFITSHSKRHRDVDSPLILGFLEHKSTGIIDAAAIVRPSHSIHK